MVKENDVGEKIYHVLSHAKSNYEFMEGPASPFTFPLFLLAISLPVVVVVLVVVVVVAGTPDWALKLLGKLLWVSAATGVLTLLYLQFAVPQTY